MARLYTPSSSSCCRSSWRGLRSWWGGCEIYRAVLLIQQPEHPQRDAVAVAELHTVKSQKAVWLILYL